MTEKIYDQNPKQLHFTGTVLSCTENEKKKCYDVILDRTAFFPEEGGQMPDKGILAGQPVLDVRLKREGPVDTIIHQVKQPIPVGSQVEGEIDWAHRFDQMQQHSGEHIISGLVHKHYGFQNVGFHLGAQEVTLDFDGSLSLSMLREIEAMANQAIYENFPVKVSFPTKEELKELTYRSKIEIPGQVRIVEFPGYDICACCAPHVERTGQIGLIKITNVQTHRGGVRVNILCGSRALADYTMRQDSTYDISVLLSVKQGLVANGVERLMAERDSLKEKLAQLTTSLLMERIKGLPSAQESPNAFLVFSELDPIASRNGANILAEKYPGLSVLLVGTDEEGYRFIIASANTDCREFTNLLRKSFGAKGGGSACMTQGTIKASAAEIRMLLASV